MKTTSKDLNRLDRARQRCLRLLQGVWLLPWLATAGLPLPDHIVYGTIAFGVRPVTSADTDVVIEARRSLNGPRLASYQMGQTPRLGEHYYELRLQLEEGTLEGPNAIQVGETLLILVRNSRGIQHQIQHLVSDSGAAQRLDFGVTVDADGDGIPDGWELATLGTQGADLAGDTDGDFASDATEYAAGTSPTNPADVFRLAVQVEGDLVTVSLRALAALGTGFEGRQRYYALDTTTDLGAGNWQAVPNHSRIPGADQLVVYRQTVGTNLPPFFRARVWLEGP